jgi:aminopeptidase N
MRQLVTLVCLWLGWASSAGAQGFTRQDTLRGSLGPARTCYDVTYYDLNVKVNVAERKIAGYNAIHFKALDNFSVLQVDLFENLKIDRVIYNDYPLGFQREGNAVFIDFKQTVPAGRAGVFKVYFQGAPRVAPNPPWDGGFTWAQDASGRPWVGVSCQELGASVWWPNKDHLSDEPDSMRIYAEVPDPLVCVANGNLVGKRNAGQGYTGYEWKVSYPINNYNVSLNIAHYAHFEDVYPAADGEKLALDYYVLDYNLDKARKHFEQVKPMLACFEKHFGKYPFWRDGYALVETSYWGMEHQSAVAYGNNYKNNSFGFDFIIVHESAHEYFGNSLSMKDNAEMWLHEAFTTYAEAVYLECLTGNFAKAVEYLQTQRSRIGNQDPMLGTFGVNYSRWRDSDIYFKGTWMLHTLRSVVANDAQWFATLREFAQTYQRSHLTTQEAIDFFCQKTGANLRPIFHQYLKHTKPPRLKYRLVKEKKNLTLYYRWETDEPGFAMPVKVRFTPTRSKDKPAELLLQPTADWQQVTRSKAQNVEWATELYYFWPELAN